MNTILEWADGKIDLTPFVQEAVARLGYVQPSAVPWLAEQIAKHGLRSGPDGFRRRGARMSRAALAAAGLPGCEDTVSEEVWERLTDFGRADPAARFDATWLRAQKAPVEKLRRERDLMFFRRESPIFTGALFSTGPLGCCADAVLLDRKALPLPPVLPLPGCDREVCGCSWRLLIKGEQVS